MRQETSCWNTCDPVGMNRVVRFPELYEIRLSVFAPTHNAHTSKFYFLEHLADAGAVLRADAHSADCSYASAELSFAGYIFRIEYASSENGELTCCVNPVAVADPFTVILVEVLRAWELGGDVELETDQTISFPSASGGRIRIQAAQEHCSVHTTGAPLMSGVYSSEKEFSDSLVESGKLNGARGTGELAVLGFNARIPLRLNAWRDEVPAAENRADALTFEVIGERIREARQRYETSAPVIRGGPFEGCYRAVTSVMNWMTVWDQLHGIPYAPVSRSWVDNYMVRMGFDKTTRGPLTGLWDCFFHSILQSVNDQSLAEGNIRVVLEDHGLMDEGYPTNYIVSTFMSGDRSQPPLGSLASWKLYRRFGDSQFLEWVFPRLKRWREWWKRRRDGNGDGLLEWGSNIDATKLGNDAGTLFAAKCESGMDNSPLYDDAGYDQRLGTMNLSDIGLNSLFAADAMYLSKIALALGNETESKNLMREYEKLAEKINAELWNERAFAYMDRHWNGVFSSRLGPTMFYPLMAGIPTPERAKAIVERHLLNENEFWGEYVIPTISRNDPAFMDQLYWRGRIWPPVNYLVYLGLRTYGFDDVAYELARRSVRLFIHEWRLRGHCHENYNALTGEGDDVPIPGSPGSNGSDRFYPWGALLALMGIEQLFDIETDEGIRFGCRFLADETRLSNVSHAGNKYSVITSSRGTTASRDGRQFFSSTPGTNVRSYTPGAEALSFSVAGEGETRFSISESAPSTEHILYQDGKEISHLRADRTGSVNFSLPLAQSYRHVLLEKRGTA